MRENTIPRGNSAKTSKNQTEFLKLRGHKVFPNAMCAVSDTLYLYDPPSGGIWSIVVSRSNGKLVGGPSLLCNMPQYSTVSQLCANSTEFIAVPSGPSSGLYQYNFEIKQLECVVSDGDELSIHGFACNSMITMFSDSKHGSVYQLRNGFL